MDLKQIIDRNYGATKRRGLITDETRFEDFLCKIEEELEELNTSNLDFGYNGFDEKFDEKELADIILVCLAMAKHYNIDIQKALEEKVIFNESRKD